MSDRLDAIKERAKVVATKPENREATYAEFSAVLRLACFDVPALVAAVESVMELHRIVEWHSGGHCYECVDGHGEPVPYPCQTVTAIREGLGEKQ